MNLSVVGPRVFVRPDNLPETTSDGLLHLVHDRQKATMTGTVIAVGDGPEFAKRAYVAGYKDAWERLCGPEQTGEPDGRVEQEHTVHVGERVIFSPDAGQELFFEKDLIVCLLEDDILAVIE